ncbi:MAG: nucleotidyltransferase domain-containing protein [Candidatus Aenigmatarchaeota archaeon]
MNISKTQIEIMKVFVSQITGRFSIRRVSETIKKTYPLVHRSVSNLLQNKIILKDEHELLYLNYKNNHPLLSYIEFLRTKDFLEKHRVISLFVKDAMNEMRQNFFIFLIFGSYAEGKERKDSDVDVLFISNSGESEKILERISSNFTVKFNCIFIDEKSACEMLSKREEINVMNETINKHILIFGAENYYGLIKNAR